VQSDYGSAFDLGCCGPEGLEQVCGKHTQGCPEVIEDELCNY
jgi:hypothetical protein